MPLYIEIRHCVLCKYWTHWGRIDSFLTCCNMWRLLTCRWHSLDQNTALVFCFDLFTLFSPQFSGRPVVTGLFPSPHSRLLPWDLPAVDLWQSHLVGGVVKHFALNYGTELKSNTLLLVMKCSGIDELSLLVTGWNSVVRSLGRVTSATQLNV